jgi:hypothetical protein
MDGSIASYVLEYVGCLIEAGLVSYLVWSREWKRLRGVAFYLACLLVADPSRVYVVHKYGLASRTYFYIYWSTDFLLVISAFVLVCFLFRRACRDEERMWRFVRLLLALVFALVAGISGLIFSRNYNNLVTAFIIEFNQNLYFTCLVLNTLLYLLLQYIESTDDQLGLLVCGVGIQFAGPAATLALLHLTAVEHFAASFNSFAIPVCTLGMLLVWAYAITRVKDKAIKVTRREIPALAEATADLNV